MPALHPRQPRVERGGHEGPEGLFRPEPIGGSGGADMQGDRQVLVFEKDPVEGLDGGRERAGELPQPVAPGREPVHREPAVGPVDLHAVEAGVVDRAVQAGAVADVGGPAAADDPDAHRGPPREGGQGGAAGVGQPHRLRVVPELAQRAVEIAQQQYPGRAAGDDRLRDVRRRRERGSSARGARPETGDHRPGVRGGPSRTWEPVVRVAGAAGSHKSSSASGGASGRMRVRFRRYNR